MNEVVTPKGGSGKVKTASRRGKADKAAAAPDCAKAAERIEGKSGAKDVMEFVMKATFLICGLVAVAFVLVISIVRTCQETSKIHQILAVYRKLVSKF